MNKLMVNGDELMGRRLEGYLIEHPERIKDLEEQTEDLVMLVLEQDVSVLRFIKNQTEEICKYAVTMNPGAVFYIRNLTPELFEYACRLEPELKDRLSDKVRKTFAA